MRRRHGVGNAGPHLRYIGRGLLASGTHLSVPATPAGTPTATLQVLDFKLNPVDLTVSGGSISIAVVNAGPTLHNVTIRDDAGSIFGATPDLREGEDAPLTATLDPGSYTMFCSLAGHESLGIKGTLTVTQP